MHPVHKTLPTALACGPRAWRRSACGGRRLHQSAARLEPKLNSVAAEKTRNIGIIAHIDAGKTTTTERMLFYSGKTQRIGNVDHGDTVTDFLPAERERGITIQSAAISIPWNSHKINIIDTPGHADFTFEVIRSLRVLDGAVTILDAVAGVEAQTEKVWRQAAALGIPRVAYVNKMDRDGAGFSRTVKEVVAKLHTRAVCVNLPYFAAAPTGEPRFAGVLDVVNKTLLEWDASDPTGKAVAATPLAAGDARVAPLYEMVSKSRESMVETLGELDERVIEEFLETEDHMAVSAATLTGAIQRATVRNQVTPVLCGSSFRNIGVQPLMDAVVAFLPSPLQIRVPELTSAATRRTGRKKTRASTTEEVAVAAHMDARRGLVVNRDPHLTVALAFKVMAHPARGVMTFFRVYSGRLASNSTVVNTRTGKKLHLKKLMLMHGLDPEEVAAVHAGNIGVVAGTGDEIATGDTLVSHGATASKSFSETEARLRLHAIEVPPPLFNASIEPATAGDARHMNDCIAMLLREDPSLSVHVDDDMGQTVLSGMGELHLEISRDRLVNTMKARVRLGAVAVSYKESVARPDGAPARCVLDDSVSAVEVSLDSFEGAAADSPFADEDGAVLMEHDNNIVILAAGAASDRVRQAAADRRWKCDVDADALQENVLRGCQTALQLGGPLFGLPLHSCVVRVHRWDFAADTKDSQPAELLAVARRAVARAVEQLTPERFCVLEPIMTTRVSVDSDALGDVVHDLNTRCQATILQIDDEGSERLDSQTWAQHEADKLYVPPDYTMKTAAVHFTNRKVVVAETPLREMVGYLSKLRSMTQGRGSFDMAYKGMSRATKARFNVIKSEFSFDS